LSHKIVAALRKSREFRIKKDPNEVRLEIVRAMTELLSAEEKVDRAARNKIRSQKREITEGSEEWDLLLRRYYAEELKKLGIDTLDLPGKQLVDAMDDPQRVRNDGIRAGGAEVIGRKAFQDLVRETVCGVHGDLQGGSIGHAGTIEVGRLDTLLVGKRLNLRGRTMHEHHADVQ